MAVFATGGFAKKSRFAERQIVVILKEAEGCIAIIEVLRSHGISAATFSIPEGISVGRYDALNIEISKPLSSSE